MAEMSRPKKKMARKHVEFSVNDLRMNIGPLKGEFVDRLLAGCARTKTGDFLKDCRSLSFFLFR